MSLSDKSMFQLLALGAKLISYKVRQFFLGTNEFVIVEIATGSIKGRKRLNLYEDWGEYYAFEGIPYAKAPLGVLRFRAPQAIKPWNNVLDCTKPSNNPIQKHMVLNYIEGSEDCLYINVYTKKLVEDEKAKYQNLLPVMVWIYGGGFQIGKASRDIYGPDYLLSKDVVLVTFNYRLGPFGFLSLKSRDLNVPGNAALKDQVAALRWVQRNIKSFNGDPNNVTVFGESAGAASIHFLMLSPVAKGLFHKAILQSGSVMCPWVWAPSNNWPLRLARASGYKEAAEDDLNILKFLMKADATRLTRQSANLRTKDECRDYILFPFGPVIEPYATNDCIIDKPYEECLSRAWGNSIPIIIGGTSFEGLYHYKETVQMPFLIKELGDFTTLLLPKFKEHSSQKEIQHMAKKLCSHYFGESSDLNVQQIDLLKYLDLMSYRSFWVGIHKAIESRRRFANLSATYCYRFDFDSEYFNHFRILNCDSLRGVCHADDISYLFSNIMASSRLSTQSKEYQMIGTLVSLWYTFAATTDPNISSVIQVDDLLNWTTIDKEPEAQNDKTSGVYNCLNIGDSLKMIPLPEYNKLMAWQDNSERN